MRNWNWYWWLVGGTVVALALKARAQKQITDRLLVVVTFNPKYVLTESIMQEIARQVPLAMQSCPGLPPVGELVELDAGQDEAGNRTVRALFKATYTHDRTGPLKEEVARCLFNALKKSNANVLGLYAARPTEGE